MQTKETKTAKELQTEISNRLGGLEVIVYDDGMSSWTAAAIVASGDVADSQQIVQTISELRAHYDLKAGPEPVGERTEPDLRAVPDTCGVWHVQGCTARGLDWLADEVCGQPDQTAVVVLDEYIVELVKGARDAGLIFELPDGPPLQAT